MTQRDEGAGRRFRVDRRQLLLGAGMTAGGALACPALARTRPTGEQTNVTETPSTDARSSARVPFHGRRQAGIVTPRPATGIVAAFDVIARTPEELRALFETLSGRIAFLMHGGRYPDRDPALPPADSGILGDYAEPDDLTITVGLGASLFDNREWLAPLKPAHLQRMVQFPNDALVIRRCHGDLSLQFCANSQDTSIHALRDIVKALSGSMVLRWKQEGSVPMTPPSDDGEAHSARNLLGFRDGSANPDAGDGDLMDRVVWVGADADEPIWARDGSYQVVRIIRMTVERWDRTPLREQETIFGRRKMSGAPLSGGTEHDVPDYAADPDGAMTPLDAHIRLANPRTPGTQDNLILRRPFNYSNGVNEAGHLEQGLIFIAYQADLEKGFLAVQKRLNGEPLEEYIRPFGGGYFFVLPGAPEDGDYLGRPLIEAVSA